MNITIENFGDSTYTALKEDDNCQGNTCVINEQIYNPYPGSKIITNDYILTDDYTTKLFLFSISIIGLYTFYKVLLK
jgi:hypothetical protein